MALVTEWENLIVENDEHRRSHFYGKYRGVVTDRTIRRNWAAFSARVPVVYGDLESHGAFRFRLSQVRARTTASSQNGDGIWIEFEAGILPRPLWTGCWWGKGDLPDPNGVDQRVLTTEAGLQIVLDDDAPRNSTGSSRWGRDLLTNSSITIKLEARRSNCRPRSVT